jgi:nucleotide-binding universal stress UspA family protein
MFRRVIVPLDGSPLAEGVLPFILEIAGPLDLEVTLVRVVTPLRPPAIEGAHHAVLDDAERRFVEARRYVDAIADTLSARGVRASAHVRRGDPVTEILAAARDANADLVAMTTHGRSGLGRLLFGSVAEAVVREAKIPVFLLRLTEATADARRAAEPTR